MLKSEAEAAVNVLKQGGTILYPTDTIWGLGCDATNPESVKKIFSIKNRPEKKSMILLVNSDQMLMRYVKEIPEAAWDIIDLSEKPITIIYDNPVGLPNEIMADDNTIAIRLTKDRFCCEVIRMLNKPIVSTSANLSGEPSPATFDEISGKIKKSVDHIVNLRQDDRTKAKASSIIRLKNNGEITIIRS